MRGVLDVPPPLTPLLWPLTPLVSTSSAEGHILSAKDREVGVDGGSKTGWWSCIV